MKRSILFPAALFALPAIAADYGFAYTTTPSAQLCRPPATVVVTPEMRITIVAAICARLDFGAGDKLQAIRKVVTDYGPTFA